MTTMTVEEDLLRVDELARRIYGTEANGNTEAILTANPGLADLGSLIPRGTVVELPERSAPAETALYAVNPWD
ncbi:tail protein X [Xanthobacter sp.]|uniref:tail protein X n=1 Tax=Xanthobacter sp. TaxID=35809 RepID=UPI0025CBB39D|nr:tail protein X [Xanthobacter sp.]